MTDRFTADSPSISLDEFNAWVEEIAEREGMSSEEVLQQLMSTYWILNELTETLGETPFGDLLDEGVEAGEPDAGDDGSADESTSTSEIVEVIRSIAELQGGNQVERPSTSIDSDVLDLIETLETGGSSGGGLGQSMGSNPFLYHEVQTLRSEIGQLEDRIADLRDLSHAIEDELDDQGKALKRSIQDLEEEVADIRGTVQTYEGHVAELEDDLDETAASVDSLEEDFSSSLSDVKRILSHLLNKGDEHDALVETIVDTYSAEFETLMERQARNQRLNELKHTAISRGIDVATCHSCENKIDVGELSSPTCPRCDSALGGFTTKSSLLSTKHETKPPTEQEVPTSSNLPHRIDQIMERLDSGSDSGEPDAPIDLAGDRSDS